MAAWHPYPYAAMMGSRSAAEQPGFIANLPRWGMVSPIHHGSGWQPYPYQAMMGNRSLTQQPGYLGGAYGHPGGSRFPGAPPLAGTDPFADYVRRMYGAQNANAYMPRYPGGYGSGPIRLY